MAPPPGGAYILNFIGHSQKCLTLEFKKN